MRLRANNSTTTELTGREGQPRSGVCAGIVTYSCDLDRLTENVAALKDQISRVFVVDNGSRNVAALRSLLDAFEDVRLLENPDNLGIATALNQLCRTAEAEGFSSILLLDQDSVVGPGMAEALVKWQGDGVGIVAPQVLDRNKESSARHSHRSGDGRVFEVRSAARKGIITSGSLVNLTAFEDVGGFDESFFIDYVDYDFDKRLLLSGYSLVRTGESYLLHECGHFRKTPFLFPRRDQEGVWRMERFYTFGHSSRRCYYKARNRILYSRKYRGSGHGVHLEGAVQLPFVVASTVLLEGQRIAKLKAFARGVADGLSTPVATDWMNRTDNGRKLVTGISTR